MGGKKFRDFFSEKLKNLVKHVSVVLKSHICMVFGRAHPFMAVRNSKTRCFELFLALEHGRVVENFRRRFGRIFDEKTFSETFSKTCQNTFKLCFNGFRAHRA